MTNKEKLSEIKRLLNKVYPGKWEIKSDKYIDDPLYQVTIWFPEIVINNSLGESLKIKDIFVRFFFHKKDMGMVNFSSYENERMNSKVFSGIRTTYSWTEWYCKYAHSHLPEIDTTDLKFEKFCVGNGTQLDNIMTMLSVEFISSSFEMFLYSIKTFLEYESIEGGPYNKISNIFRNDKNLNNYFSAASLEEFYDIYKKNGIDCSIKISNIKGVNVIKVIKDDAFEESVTNVVKNNVNSKNALCYKGAKGNYYSVEIKTSRELAYNNLRDCPILTFKRTPFYLKIEDNIQHINIKKYANPEITDFIAKKLAREITEYSIRASRVNRSTNSKVTAECDK